MKTQKKHKFDMIVDIANIYDVSIGDRFMLSYFRDRQHRPVGLCVIWVNKDELLECAYSFLNKTDRGKWDFGVGLDEAFSRYALARDSEDQIDINEGPYYDNLWPGTVKRMARWFHRVAVINNLDLEMAIPPLFRIEK